MPTYSRIERKRKKRRRRRRRNKVDEGRALEVQVAKEQSIRGKTRINEEEKRGTTGKRRRSGAEEKERAGRLYA